MTGNFSQYYNHNLHIKHFNLFLEKIRGSRSVGGDVQQIIRVNLEGRKSKVTASTVLYFPTLVFSVFLLILISRRLSVISELLPAVPGVFVLTPMLGVTLLLAPPGVRPGVGVAAPLLGEGV